MTMELVPMGQKCNIRCTYCYQNPMRDGESEKSYDIDKMLAQTDSHFTLFGGEPLLVPLDDLEKFFKYGLEKYNQNGIQTNGTILTSTHIDLFLKYKVQVGISVDGPGVLNSPRAPMPQTEKIMNNIRRLVAVGIIPSMIVTMHKANLSREDIFINWFKSLEKLGIRHIRLHFMENDDADDLVPPPVKVVDFLLKLHDEKLKITFDILDVIPKLLKDPHDDSASCVWNGCDAFTTPAVQGIAGDGSKSNCGRVNKDGVDYRKAEGDVDSRERTWALWNTAFQDGGCKGCRFFLACTGHCPGSGLEGDWRNRSEHCEVIYALFEAFENEKSFSLKDNVLERTDEFVDNGGKVSRSYHEDAWLIPTKDSSPDRVAKNFVAIERTPGSLDISIYPDLPDGTRYREFEASLHHADGEPCETCGESIPATHCPDPGSSCIIDASGGTS